ncbi:heavy-metal-associated domain-containing protein [Bengtsoniella intestinalis]|uniref:heavy-metal-associated domain-containing protein n=1 Tax=Bengtsoniella intestinalis TaxID=3073143 RepID=UPI00391F2D1B
MTTLNVPDMHCPKCVARISDALTAADVAFQVNLEAKTVAVDEAKVDLAISELDDLGFDATV